MELKILKLLVDEKLSQRQIAKKLGRSEGSIRHWLSKYGLKTLGRQRRGQRDSHVCKLCEETDLSAFYVTKDGYLKNICRKCDTKRVAERSRKIKKQSVDYKGGKCEMCGYYKCLGSLEFHHLDPSTKDPNWNVVRRRSFDKIKKELDKCILLCRNCHGELHHGNKGN